MGQNDHNLSDIDLVNLSLEVNEASLKWLDHLKETKSSAYKVMRDFVIALNKAKTSPVSQNGKDLINQFEIVLVRLDPKANLIIRTAQYLIDNNAVRMPSP